MLHSVSDNIYFASSIYPNVKPLKIVMVLLNEITTNSFTEQFQIFMFLYESL